MLIDSLEEEAKHNLIHIQIEPIHDFCEKVKFNSEDTIDDLKIDLKYLEEKRKSIFSAFKQHSRILEEYYLNNE